MSNDKTNMKIKSSKQLADEAELIKYISDRLDDASEAPRFLKAGLSNDLSLGEFFTPDVFREFFLVKPKSHEENDAINALVHDLVRSDRFNILCLEAGRGCGKSTFVNTTFFVKDSKNRYEFEYPYTYIDLNRRTISFKYCEDVVFELFAEQLKKINADPQWRASFYEFVDNVVLPEGYNTTFKNIVEKCKSEDLNDIRDGHAARCLGTPEFDIKIYLLLYLAALSERPHAANNPDSRWVIIFDGIEAYVTTDAEDVAVAIVDIHKFLSNAYNDRKKRPKFFTNFSFVIPVRTATCLSLVNSFGTQGTEIMGENYDYIFSLPVYDFSLHALLKKMYFLANNLGKDYNEVSKSDLFVACMGIVSTLIPKQIIEQYLINRITIDEAVEKIRYFAEQRLLPLLNYDYRSAIDKLIQLSRRENQDDFYGLQRIENEIQENKDVSIEYAANGKNMIVARTIFNIFRRTKLLDEIGYTAFDSDHQPGIARTMFNFLYYKEMISRYKSRYQRSQNKMDGEYEGIYFNELLDRLKPFAKDDISRLAEILFSVSALNSGSVFSRVWTNLIVLKGLKQRMTSNDFRNMISEYYSSDENSVQHKKLKEKFKEWTVKLSDAGMCFTSWGSKQFEFLLARVPDHNGNALFAYDAYTQLDDVKDVCRSVYRIIKEEAIGKLVRYCLDGCAFCSDIKNTAYEYCRFDTNLLECSLFQRYQECVFLIIDSIDYVDRYRIYTYQYGKAENKPSDAVNGVNKDLLVILLEYWTLFDNLNKAITGGIFGTHSDTFFAKLRDVQKKYSGMTSISERRNMRTPYSNLWNLATEEQRNAVTSIAEKNPTKATSELYSLLKEELIRDKLVAELGWDQNSAEDCAEQLGQTQYQDINNALIRWVRYGDEPSVREGRLTTEILVEKYGCQYPAALWLLYYNRIKSPQYTQLWEKHCRIKVNANLAN